MILRTGYQTVNVGYVRPNLLQWVSLEHQSNVPPSYSGFCFFYRSFISLLLTVDKVIWIQIGFNGNSFKMFLSLLVLYIISSSMYVVLFTAFCLLCIVSLYGWVGGKVGSNGVDVLSYLRV